MSLATPATVQKLQTALHANAKEAPDYRFYRLYDKVCRVDVLAHAYAVSRSHGGAPGVDGETFADIESSGREVWLRALAQDLAAHTYRASAVRRGWAPKRDGTRRPLGIPTIRDRVVQTAVLLVIGPIFEADLPPEQHAYRPERSALDAVREVHRQVNTGPLEVVDADLSGYFDSIPHEPLLKSVARRVCDQTVLHLLKSWLVAAVEETDVPGGYRRTTAARDAKRGTPQGAPISPLLAKVYMRRFVLGWKTLGPERRWDAHLVNYADDFVLCCRGSADRADRDMRELMARLGLTVNEAKTCIRRLPDESVDFLGYTIGRCYSPRTGRAYLGTRPAKDRVPRLVRTLHEDLCRSTLWQEPASVVATLNARLRGWAHYFCLGPVSQAYRAVDSYVTPRLRWWLCRKYPKACRGRTHYPDEYLYETLGLLRLGSLRRDFSCAKA